MSNSSATPTSVNLNSTRSKTDITWKHCETVDDSTGKGRTILKCNYCTKIYRGGGIHRMKEHLGRKKGDAQACPRVPAEVQYQIDCSLRNVTKEKKKINCDSSEISPVTVDDETSEEDQNIVNPTAKNKKIEKSKEKKMIDNFFAPRITPSIEPGINSALATKSKDDSLVETIGKWMCDAGIPFNATNSCYFQPMIDAISSIGPGYKAPSYHDIRGSILKNNVNEMKGFTEAFRNDWKEKGCTIMANSWIDKRNRTLINFFVNCPKGTVFLKSIDATTHSETTEMSFDLFKEVVEFVGPGNVVQLITNNASNYMAVGKLFGQKFPRIFWSSCVVNCIDLILEDFDKFLDVKWVLNKAQEVTKFIYSDIFILNLMKKHTNGNEVIHSAITRFATNFLTLHSLSNNKDGFQNMISSKEWFESKWSKCKDGMEFENTILSSDFWTFCGLVAKIGEPLLKILRMVDGDDRPAMGYIFEGMQMARREIEKALKENNGDYLRFLKIIDLRWDDQFYKTLPAAGYWLNPEFFYNKNTSSFNHETISQVFDCIEKMYADDESKQVNISKEIKLYKEAGGHFGRPMAINARDKMLPADWWENFGGSAPNLQEMAIRILSQACRSSGCEHNWSVFERMHTIKMNRLEYQRLSDLIFVQYNLRLTNRETKKNMCNYPISFEEIDILGDWVVETTYPILKDEDVRNWLEKDQLLVGDQVCEDTVMAHSRKIEDRNERPAIICKFFSRGCCIKGSACRFLHQNDGVDNTEDMVVSKVELKEDTEKFVSGKSLNRRFLSESEEQMVIELHACFGDNWSKIASYLTGITPAEIQTYWFLHTKKKLDSGLLKHKKSLGWRPLSESEEQMVIDLYARFGCSWSKIAAHIPGRNSLEIRNYWHTHIEKKLRKERIDSPLLKPISSLLDLSKEDQNKSNEISVELSSIIETTQEEKGTTNPYIEEKSSANLLDFTENSDDGFSTDEVFLTQHPFANIADLFDFTENSDDGFSTEVPLIQPHELHDPFAHSASSITSCSSFSCLSQMSEDLRPPCLDLPPPCLDLPEYTSFWDDWPGFDVDNTSLNLDATINFDQDDLLGPKFDSEDSLEYLCRLLMEDDN